MRLLPAEKFVVTLILVLAALDLALLSYKHVAIDIPGYISALMTGGVAVAIGQFYRRFRHNEGIALATTAAGLFIIFSIVGSVFNYLLLPIVQQPVDGALAAFDEALGFSWLGFAAWTAGHPWLSAAYRLVYMSSMPQLIAVILILGFSKRAADLHLFLLTGLIGALLTISWWAFFPSFGATAFYSVPQDLLTVMPIIVGPEYGAELKRLAAQGVSYISPKDVLGLIGFPSFHTVMSPDVGLVHGAVPAGASGVCGDQRVDAACDHCAGRTSPGRRFRRSRRFCRQPCLLHLDHEQI